MEKSGRITDVSSLEQEKASYLSASDPKFTHPAKPTYQVGPLQPDLNAAKKATLDRDKMRDCGAVIGGFGALLIVMSETCKTLPCLDVFTTDVGSGE
ncbi:hypothetical protein FRC04_003477 [Tulasnella sp. 424]|nr:hypothetical protein FRC04_003477 [Tulasnella sp. 424]KAG8965740.1 hypothetical protein FRC05_003057 [Tulasnella sp. 425]